MALTDDPSYLALMRAMGFNDAEAADDAALAETKAKAQIDLYRPEIDYQGEIARENIGVAHEDPGMFRSGQHLTAVARQEHDQALQLGELDLHGAESVADIQRTLAAEQAANARRLGDQGLVTDARQYLDQGLRPFR